jgi:hypothetical protein
MSLLVVVLNDASNFKCLALPRQKEHCNDMKANILPRLTQQDTAGS